MTTQKSRDAISANVSKIIKELRDSKELSMAGLADAAGLSRSMVSLVERGLRNPSLETLLRIASVLEIPLSDVIKRAEKAAAKSS